MPTTQSVRTGLLLALSAFTLWGLAPIYYKVVNTATPMEVLSHRIIWSAGMLIIALSIRRQWRQVRLLTWQTLRLLALSSLLISLNWLVFIWAVGQNRIIETSLGYFINPLVSVILGMLFLGERLRRRQVLAILLTVIGVVNQIWAVGSLPWIALVLAFSFGFYGLIRKTLRVDPIIGLFLETSLALPFALGYLLWLYSQAQLVFGHHSLALDGLLFLAGLITTVPLLLFAEATQRLSLTVMGLVQYTAPTLTFLLAVLLYHEPFSRQQLLTFICIWCSLALFTAEGVHYRKRLAALTTRGKTGGKQ